MIVQNNLNGRYKDIVHFINDQKETTKVITISVKNDDLHLPQDLVLLTSPMSEVYYRNILPALHHM